MKKFIYKVILFLVVIITAAYALDYAISSGLKRMDDYRFQTWTAIVDSKINADLLILGNSRAFSHYSPIILDSALQLKCYNLGIGGHPFNIHYLRYKLYKEHNILPKVIIMNVDFFTFRVAPFGHQREQVLPFVRDSLFRHELSKVGFSRTEIYLPLFRYFGYQMVIKNGLIEFFHLHHYNSQPSLKGYFPENDKWDSKELKKMDKIESFAEPNSIKMFEKFIFECKNSNIKLVLVNSPIYYKAIEKISNNNKFDTLFKNIAQKYSLPYLDYSKDSICTDSNYFHVAIHLNMNGSKWFSRKLSADLKNIIDLK